MIDEIKEKRLGTAWSTINSYLLNPFLNLQTEQEKEQFRKKHPEVDEVLEIVNETNANNVSIYLRNIQHGQVVDQRMQKKKD